MLPDQRAEIQEWLYGGHLDEVTAEQLLIGPRIVPETAVFHCQQLANADEFHLCPPEQTLSLYLTALVQPASSATPSPR